MEFKEIAAVSGKSGLFRILKPTRNGVVLESLDEKKEKLVISSSTKVSILKDISMYTLSAEGNKPLAGIMVETKKVFGNALPVDAKSNEKELRSFFKQVVPDFDSDRVYTSDIKKLVIWYGIIATNCPEVLEPQAETEANDDTLATVETIEVKPAKASSKKISETEPNANVAEDEKPKAKETKPKKVKA